MNTFPIWTGKVRIELTSADTASRIGEINSMGIPLADIEKSGDLAFRATLLSCHLKIVQSLAEKRGDRVVILDRDGFYWSAFGLKRRPILLTGIVILLLSTLLLPNLVLFVSVEGSTSIPDRLILDQAQTVGIKFGAARGQVRSEKVKNLLLDAIPQLQWAGINTSGCKAIITVKERNATKAEMDKYMVSNMVASGDGVISSCTVTNGTANCTVGQAVQKGQLLVSGYSDCGNFITAGRAEAEIFATTRHRMRAVMPLEHTIRGQFDNQTTKYSLCIGKKRINLYKGSGIYDSSCVKMESQYQLTLPGGFEVPVVLIRQHFIAYQLETIRDTDLTLDSRLSACLQSQLRNICVACTITDAQERYATESDIAILDAVYNCIEMIGREQVVQIGDFHG